MSAETDSDNRGPFGLTWGASSDDVRKLGVSLDPQAANTDYGVEFGAANLPKVISDVADVALWFGYNDKLWRVGAFSRPFGPDPYGNEAVTRYQALSASLADRYGRGQEVNTRDTEMWKSPSEYLMSLKQGRARRFTEFGSSATEVELSLRAKDADTAFYVILFAFKPGARQFYLEKNKHEKDAL